jgi:Flp pilus assembly protein TadB
VNRWAVLSAALLAAAAAATLVPPRGTAHRLGLVPGARRTAAAAPRRAAGLRRPLHPAVAAVLVGVAVAALLGGAPGVIGGVVTALAAVRFLRRLEPAARRQERERCVAGLPLLVDLVAAALRIGVPVEVALSAAGRALGGPLGERAERVAALVRLGGRDDATWSGLADVPGGPPLARALARALDDGLAAGDVLARHAAQLRDGRRAQGLERARRVGVLATVPLGLCLLPAFVLVGVVPVIIAGFAGLGW